MDTGSDDHPPLPLSKKKFAVRRRRERDGGLNAPLLGNPIRISGPFFRLWRLGSVSICSKALSFCRRILRIRMLNMILFRILLTQRLLGQTQRSIGTNSTVKRCRKNPQRCRKNPKGVENIWPFFLALEVRICFDLLQGPLFFCRRIRRIRMLIITIAARRRP